MLFAVTAEGVVTFTTWIAAVDTTENRKFLRNYRAEYDDQEPDAFAALSRPSVYILAQAIADASSTVTHLLGEFHFDCNGDAVYEPVVARVRDGRFEVFRQ